jgi:hypothetical protein
MIKVLLLAMNCSRRLKGLVDYLFTYMHDSLCGFLYCVGRTHTSVSLCTTISTPFCFIKAVLDGLAKTAVHDVFDDGFAGFFA